MKRVRRAALALALVAGCSKSPTRIPTTTTTTPTSVTSTTAATTTTVAVVTTTSAPVPSTTEPTVPASIAPASACGVERWAVKVGLDPDASSVNLADVKTTTLGDLVALPAPRDPTRRLAPVETTVYEVHATITAYKLEGDSDYHIVVSDEQGNHMIVEVPHPDCMGASPFKQAVTSARAALESRFAPTSTLRHVSVPVTVRGVGFFDYRHGQTGVAPNAIELHPVLGLQFG